LRRTDSARAADVGSVIDPQDADLMCTFIEIVLPLTFESGV